MVARSTPLAPPSPWRFPRSSALVPAKPDSSVHPEPIRHNQQIRPSKAFSFDVQAWAATKIVSAVVG